MGLSVKGLAIASAILWGGCMLFVGLLNLTSSSYGAEFLKVMSSVYPGFHAVRTLGDTLVGTGYGIADGAIAGGLFAWLYNAFARPGGRG